MSIEATLERIAVALEKIAAGSTAVSEQQTDGSSSKSTPKKSPGSTASKDKASTKSAESKSGSKDDSPTKDDVRAALKNLQKAKSAADARQLLADHGAKTLTDLKPEQYAAVIEAAEEAIDG